MAIQRMAYSTDVRGALGLISAPTLVLSRGSTLYRTDHSEYLAASIPNARLVELDGSDHYWWADAEPVLAEIEEFLTGARSEPAPDRVFATVLFTDIVGSTSLAASMGDAAWTETLDAHDALVRRQLERYHGTEINTTGDGFVAKFRRTSTRVQCGLAIVAGVARSALRYVLACTPESAPSADRTWAAWRCTSQPESELADSRARSLSLKP